MKRLILSLITGFLGGILGTLLILSAYQFTPEQAENTQTSKEELSVQTSYEPESLKSDQLSAAGEIADAGANFSLASEKSTPSVVYIRTITEGRYARSWIELFFEGGTTTQQVSTGSGVIYTADGYIITNNHVIEGADLIQVIIGKNEYDATVVGTDPSTDLAVLKIEEDKLNEIEIGSSRELKVGDWVLAVGNPFNLNSTVTAGIVSAKGRDINILKGQFPLESFIQTDAAINPGNSGGALVDIEGRLVGINTAILSRTGSYAGYGFAVPVDIVQKVVDDIIEYGEVQKAFIGADVIDIDLEVGERLELDNLDGVLVYYLQKDGAADNAGLKKGDIIVGVNGYEVDNRSAFEEQLSYYSPGDKITLTVRREGKNKTIGITLVNREGTTEVLKKEIYTSTALGADFEVVSKIEKDMMGIENGVRVIKVEDDGFIRRLKIEEGFVITKINNITIKSPDQLTDILSRIKGRVIIEGINKRGQKDYYAYYF